MDGKIINYGCFIAIVIWVFVKLWAENPECFVDRESGVFENQNATMASLFVENQWSKKRRSKRFTSFTDRTEKLTIPMVAIKGGSLYMGSPERYVHRILPPEKMLQISVQNFYLAKYEVTQAQWRAVMGATTLLSDPSFFKGCDSCPVENVSWNNVQLFLRKLSEITGKKYRLPSEAEWEYAAKGKNWDEKRFYYGWEYNDLPDEEAWYTDNSENQTHPVGTKKANDYGLYDMLGNVWELCADDMHRSRNEEKFLIPARYLNHTPYDRKPWIDGQYKVISYFMHITGIYSMRADRWERGEDCVIKGGAWDSKEYYCVSSFRVGIVPNAESNTIGFRLALDADGR